MKQSILIILLFSFHLVFAQTNQKIYEIIDNVSSERIKTDIKTLKQNSFIQI